MPSYPASVRVFTTKANAVDIIDASHPNSLQDEVASIQTTVGANPHISTAPNPAGTFTSVSTTFATVAARLANIETGIVADVHNQYLHIAGGDTMSGSAAGVIVHRVRARSDQTGALVRVESFDQATAYFQVTTGGVAMTAATVAGSPVLTSATGAVVSSSTASASGVGDAATVGTATTAARADHVHGREAFGAVTSATSYGLAVSNGTASTVARADHQHGTPAASSVTLGTVVAAQSFGIAAANGTLASVSRSDHTHGTPVAPVTSTVAGTGIGLPNGTTGAVTIVNTGVVSLTGSTGLGVSAATGAVTLTNTGVTGLTGSTGLGVSAGTGAVTLTNTGVTSLAGAGAATVSAASGGVTVTVADTNTTATTRQFARSFLAMAGAS